MEQKIVVTEKDIIKAWRSFDLAKATFMKNYFGSQNGISMSEAMYNHLRRNGHAPILQAMLDNLFPMKQRQKKIKSKKKLNKLKTRRKNHVRKRNNRSKKQNSPAQK